MAKRIMAEWHEASGQGLVEYALILVLVAVVVIVVLVLLGPQIADVFGGIYYQIYALTGAN